MNITQPFNDERDWRVLKHMQMFASMDTMDTVNDQADMLLWSKVSSLTTRRFHQAYIAEARAMGIEMVLEPLADQVWARPAR